MDKTSDIMIELRFGYLGDYPVAGMGEPWSSKLEETHRLLKQSGIGAILCLTEDDLYGKQHEAAGFRFLHIPIDDTFAPTAEGMDQAVVFIKACLEDSIGVAAHCFEGRGRTGTILCGWLGLRESLNSGDAINRIRHLRHHTVLTPPQKQFLAYYLDEYIPSRA
jgi:atypical dual specificity phosphatase